MRSFVGEYVRRWLSCKSNFFIRCNPFFFILICFIFAFHSVHAEPEKEAYIFTGSRNIKIDSNSPSVFRGLTSKEATITAYALISRNEKKQSNQPAVLDLLAGLPDGQLWKDAAAAWFQYQGESRTSRLTQLASQQGAASPASLLLRVENASKQKPVAIQFQDLGPAVQNTYEARRLLDKPPSSFEDIHRLLTLLELALSDAGDLPFADRLLADLPERLDEAGLPLEAAVVGRAIQRQHQVPAIEKQIASYLVRAGDFHGALRAAEANDPMLYRNSQTALRAMNWMIFAGDYRRALDIHSKWLSKATFSTDDSFTGFQLSRNFVRARSAALLYLLGESKEALVILDNIAKSKAFDTDVGYARLLQAQLLFEDNTDLARQIAEDITFRAQESSLYLLEYHATVLEGLALQRLGKDYAAWINFVKARGIIRSHLKNPPTAALALGQLLAGFKLTPTASLRPYVNELLAAEDAMGVYEPAAMFVYQMPAKYNSLIWKKLLFENLSSRGRSDEIAELQQMFLSRPVMHRPSANPGGLTGLADVMFWNQLPTGVPARPLPGFMQSANVPAAASKAAVATAVQKRAFVFLQNRNHTLWLQFASAKLTKSGILSNSCLMFESGSDCSEDQKVLRSAFEEAGSVKGDDKESQPKATVLLQTGVLPSIQFIDNAWQFQWLMAGRLLSLPGQDTNRYFRLCSSQSGISNRLVTTLNGMSQWSSGSLLLGSFQKRSSTSPIYLSQLACPSMTRLWDVDRFSSIPANSRWLSPASTAGGAQLARLMTRFGASWVEYDPKETDSDVIEKLVLGRDPLSGNYRIISPLGGSD